MSTPRATIIENREEDQNVLGDLRRIRAAKSEYCLPLT
jgi:hypothetical protein